METLLPLLRRDIDQSGAMGCRFEHMLEEPLTMHDILTYFRHEVLYNEDVPRFHGLGWGMTGCIDISGMTGCIDISTIVTEWKILGKAPLTIFEILGQGAYRILYDRYYVKEGIEDYAWDTSNYIGLTGWTTDANTLTTGQFAPWQHISNSQYLGT